MSVRIRQPRLYLTQTRDIAAPINSVRPRTQPPHKYGQPERGLTVELKTGLEESRGDGETIKRKANMKRLTMMTARWTGLRAEKCGRSSRLLRKSGFWRQHHAQVNNRNGCDWIKPCGPLTLKDAKPLFARLASAGFVGVAFQWLDIQWKHTSGLTELQWKERIRIG